MSVIKYKVKHLLIDVQVDVFAGPDEDHLELAGSIVLKQSEWAGVKAAALTYNDYDDQGVGQKTKFIIQEKGS